MAEPTPLDTSVAQIVAGQKYKDEGNDFFKSGNIDRAIKRYHCGLLQVQNLRFNDKNSLASMCGMETAPKARPLEEAHLEDKAKELRKMLYNNLSACFVERTNWVKVQKYATSALEIDPCDVKALRRLGMACYHQRDFQQAVCNFESVLQQTPNDQKTQKFLEQAKQQDALADGRVQAMYSHMFRPASA